MSKERIFIADNIVLMKEWNWIKNEELGIKPDEVPYGFSLKVW